MFGVRSKDKFIFKLEELCLSRSVTDQDEVAILSELEGRCRVIKLKQLL